MYDHNARVAMREKAEAEERRKRRLKEAYERENGGSTKVETDCASY